MGSLDVPSPSSSNSDGESPDRTLAPDSSRHTSHTGKQTQLGGLGYGVMVAWDHLRPFIPFFLISFMVVALVYLMQAIIFGGPFKDPFPVPSSSFEQVLFESHRDNETM
ncbi:Zinc finger protein 469 [Dissostichus eleginoides]|uniref:Zinc finger protein 469 n=1 Tax=Dissostichus eleginoides TaxID=100907 RepID=A0AAD9FML5_DISEL|nr:Zinc finger protein 469 [Dissostichus eleginoides]